MSPTQAAKKIVTLCEEIKGTVGMMDNFECFSFSAKRLSNQELEELIIFAHSLKTPPEIKLIFADRPKVMRCFILQSQEFDIHLGWEHYGTQEEKLKFALEVIAKMEHS